MTDREEVKLRDLNAGVAGVGATEFQNWEDRGVLQLASDALQQSLDDSGLSVQDIDGLLVHIGSPRGQDYDRVAEGLGLDIRYALQTWSHGRFMASLVANAALTVSNGLADCVACIAAYKNSGFPRIGQEGNPFFHEVLRQGAGPHGEQGHLGMLAPAGGAAMAWSLYQNRYHTDPNILYGLAESQRRYASANPRARLRSPLCSQEYWDSPWVVEPLRRFDCSIPTDGAVCVLVTRSDGTSSPDVQIIGDQGLRAGKEQFIFAPRGLGLWQQSDQRPTEYEARRQPVYQTSTIKPEEVDIFYTYDAFTPLVLFALEEFGFCPPGEATNWVSERLETGHRLPVNTSGGLLSEGHMNGWGHIVEAVMQLRGDAGERQVPDARYALWGALAGDALMLSAA